jgi:hypothetical protein
MPCPALNKRIEQGDVPIVFARDGRSQPVDEIARALVEDDERSRDLRQNSPFAGALTEPGRRRVTDAVSRSSVRISNTSSRLRRPSAAMTR